MMNENNPFIKLNTWLDEIEKRLDALEKRLDIIEKELWSTKERHDYEDTLSEERSERS